MVTAHSDGNVVEIPAVLAHQYLVGRFSISGDGLSAVPLHNVLVRLTAAKIEAPDVDKDGNVTRWQSERSVRAWRYGEVEKVQVFRSPHWVSLHLSPRPPFGTRIHFGEWRSPILLFTEYQDALLNGLTDRGLSVDRDPITLNPLLFGRR